MQKKIFIKIKKIVKGLLPFLMPLMLLVLGFLLFSDIYVPNTDDVYSNNQILGLILILFGLLTCHIFAHHIDDAKKEKEESNDAKRS